MWPWVQDRVPCKPAVQVVGTNVLGSLLGSREAIRVMRRQPPSKQPIYHVFNCGFSAWGAKVTCGPAAAVQRDSGKDPCRTGPAGAPGALRVLRLVWRPVWRALSPGWGP
jgi:hypothetical protein